jgi:hypothetical protein
MFFTEIQKARAMRQMKWTKAFLIAGVLLLNACGENSGTPQPVHNNSDGDQWLANPDGASLQLADSHLWRAELKWSQAPRFSDEEFLEMTGAIFLRHEDGRVPSSVTNVSFTADMPQHGHGTGSILPRVEPTANDPGRYTFNNLFFTMTGLWRIRVWATLDGYSDVWTTTVDVK